MPTSILAEPVAYTIGGILESLRDKNGWFWIALMIILIVFFGLIVYFN